MLRHRNQPSPSPPPDGESLTGLVRTHWMLAVCVVARPQACPRRAPPSEPPGRAVVSPTAFGGIQRLGE